MVSPYLRALRAQGQLVIDNYLTGQHTPLSGAAAEVLRALWPREGAAPGQEARTERELAALGARLGLGALEEALARLSDAGLLVQDAAQARALYEALLGGPGEPVPFIDQIELTNRCPMRCGFCPRGVPGRMSRPTGFMDLGLFRRLLPQLHPLQRRYRPLELHHLGESLLHPQVADFVAAARDAGLPTEMSVNPALLTPALGERLLQAGLRRLVLSLDGVDEETLVAIRGPAASYRRAEAHLEALLERVAAQPDPPTVVIQMIDLARNRHQREALQARWGGRGLPTVHVYVKDLDGPDPDLGHGTGTPQQHLCTYPFRSVVVLWDGRVVPCCRDDDAGLVLGDLNREALAEIWQGPRCRELRAQHLAGRFPEGHLCAGCAWQPARFAATLAQRHPDLAKEEPLRW